MRSDARGSRLRIGAHRMRGCTVVIPDGEVDLATRDDLRECLAQCEGPVIIDLARVSFLDSAGIGVIISQRNRLQSAGGSLLLRDPIDHVRNVLDTVGLSALIAD